MPVSLAALAALIAGALPMSENAMPLKPALMKGNTVTKTLAATPLAVPAATLESLVPSGFGEAGRMAVTVDKVPATFIRHTRETGRNAHIGGEHVSVVVGENGVLKRFTRMDASLAGGALPSRQEARAIAFAFLARHAPDLLANPEVHWVEPHDESIRVEEGGVARAVTLTGMKVKMRNPADGRWFWVIVGSDSGVMTFERDIVWITFPGRRQTEKWLHDGWLKDKGHAQAFPPAL